MLIIKNQDDTLVTNWFIKNTFSGRYSNFLSNHPFKQKIVIIKNLVDTAILLSHEKFHEENLEIINVVTKHRINNKSDAESQHILIGIVSKFYTKNQTTLKELLQKCFS